MDRKRARAALHADRKRLEGLLSGVRGDVKSGDEPDAETPNGEAFTDLSVHDQHPADIGSEMFEQEKSHSILASLEAELHEVDRALDRVREGSYGLCEACRRPIPAARLTAQPATRYCLKDQARVEREVRAS